MKTKRPVIPHPTDHSLFLVELTMGYWAVIDAADAIEVGRSNWYAKLDPRTTYAARKVHGRCERLHRFIASLMGISLEYEIDHINRNGLDCRRSNLRSATHAENQRNRSLQANNASGFKGVSRMVSGRWRAQLGRVKLGCFGTPEEAGEAVRVAREAAHGEFANHGTN